MTPPPRRWRRRWRRRRWRRRQRFVLVRTYGQFSFGLIRIGTIYFEFHGRKLLRYGFSHDPSKPTNPRGTLTATTKEDHNQKCHYDYDRTAATSKDDHNHVCYHDRAEPGGSFTVTTSANMTTTSTATTTGRLLDRDCNRNRNYKSTTTTGGFLTKTATSTTTMKTNSLRHTTDESTSSHKRTYKSLQK